MGDATDIEQMDRVKRMMDESEVPEAVCAEMIDGNGWEANLVPIDAKSVLVLGCADGTEIMFLRAVLPDASIYGGGLSGPDPCCAQTGV